MKKSSSLFLRALSVLLLLAIALPASSDVEFKSGVLAMRQGEFQLPDRAATPGVIGNAIHAVVELNHPLKSGDRERLSSHGVELLTFLQHNTYVAAVNPRISAKELARLNLRAVSPLFSEFKIHPRVTEARFSDWSLMPDGDRIFMVEIMRDVTLEDAAEDLTQAGFKTGQVLEAAHSMMVACDPAQIPELSARDYVLFIDELPPPLEPTNDTIRERLHVNPVQTAPYNLSGAGVTLLVFDGGMVDATHPDFAGRITLSEIADVADHPTHTCGTAGGSGANSGGTYRGMAPGVTLISGQYDFCIPNCFYNSPYDIEADYINTRTTYGIELTTNSMGANVNSNNYPCEWLGDYETTSRLLDGLVRQTVNAPLLMCWSAGNERNDGWCGITQYGCVSIPASAKNIITVGATTSTDGSASFSSWGPVDDGRIKPEVVATGSNINSCAPGGGYQIMSGTSMSCPAVAGVAALMLEQWHTMHPGAPDPLPETMKALLINSANDLGNTGPDYRHGFGIVDAQEAADQLIAGGVLEAALQVGGSFTYALTVPQNTPELRISIAWSDVPATVGVAQTLVNDLDLTLTDALDTDYSPWILDPANPDAAATTGPDHTNVCEQVYVANPTPGEWTITVSGSVNDGLSQNFGLVANVPLVTAWTTISGQLKDINNEQGVPGRVSIFGGSQTTWTDGEGNYTLSVPRGATYSLSAESYGYNPATFELVANSETQTHDFLLSVAAMTQLSGTITNQAGAPLAGAIVSFDFPYANIADVVTDESGNYTKDLPDLNRYEVTADYEGATQSATAVLAGPTTLNIEIYDPRIYPAGPDDYGYYCYEIQDTGLVVAYDFQSILPSQGGSGTLLTPGDGNDWTVTIDVPFTIRYYNTIANQITISADGWIGMGATTTGDQPWTNIGIPDITDPDAIVCIFWDDLFPFNPTEGGEIGYYYDAANGRFIVEYNNVSHYNPLTNKVTAQLQIYDQEIRPTVTLDNEFEMHFAQFDYEGPGSEVDADATIGIESPNGNRGLQVVYDGNYNTFNYEVRAGTALRFTTGLFVGVGAVGGTIVTVPPAEDYSIFNISFSGYEGTANPNGTYLIENVDARQYRVTIAADGYETQQSPLITVVDGETATVNFSDVYRLDPARNLDGAYDFESNSIQLIWDRPLNSSGGLDEFTLYDVFEQSRGVLASQADTFYSWTPPGIGVYNFWIIAQYNGGTAVNSDSARIVVTPNAAGEHGLLPAEYSLSQNYPNPFNPTTQIRYGLPQASDVKLDVFDLLGRTVATLVNQSQPAGYHTVEFNAANLGTGVYFYRLRAAGFEQINKMFLVR